MNWLTDQSKTNESEEPIAKSNQEIKPDSLQNPSDPDATYRKKAGEHHTGYVANIVETFNDEGDSLITDFSFAQNKKSDSEFCKEAISNIAEKGESTEENKVMLISDATFGSAANQELAKENNIILVTTALTGQKPPEVFADFEIDNETNQVLRCPAGNEPLRQGHNPLYKRYRIVMEKSQCANCVHREECNAKMQSKSAMVIVSENKVERAKIIKDNEISSETYTWAQNARNAIEGIPSAMRRTYCVDELPVYGSLKSKLLVGLKISAYNLKKLMKHIKMKAVKIIQESCPQAQCVEI